MIRKYFYYHYYIAQGSSLDDYLGCFFELILVGLVAFTVLFLTGIALFAYFRF